MRRTQRAGGPRARRTDWSRATERMPASFADQPRRDAPLEGRRNDDGLDLVEVVAATATLAAVAELASGNEPVQEIAEGVKDEDVVAAADEEPAAPPFEQADEED